MMDTLLHDVRFGLRQLRKSPAFTIAAVLTLALGVGANVTVFTWLNALMFNPLPGVEASSLVTVRWKSPEGNSTSFSWPDYLDYRQRSTSVESLTVGRMAAFSLGEGSEAARIWGMLTAANYFHTMGVHAELGRTFTAEEDQGAGAHPVVVLSHGLWQSRFGSDPGIVGRQIQLNKQAFTVIGVAQAPFQGSTLGLRLQMWVPAVMQQAILSGSGTLDSRGSHWLEGWARLKPGVDRRKVEAELSGISAQLSREFSQSERYPRAITTPVWREGGGQLLAPIMILLMGVVGVVLLIVCANISNLLLGRAAGRRREIAVRLALGVGRARLIRQLMTESALLAVFGCAAALAVIPLTQGLLQRFIPSTDLPVSLALQADSTVALFAFGLSIFATLLFGLLPALRASRPDMIDALKDDGGGALGQRKSWLRNSLVVAQVSLSLTLLIAAGLLLKSLSRAQNADPGFDPRNVLVAGVDFLPNGYDAARGRIALGQMTEKIAALPGVAAVSTIRRVPLGIGGTSSTSFEAEGYVAAKDEELMTYTHVIGPDYFHTMNTQLVAGREFTPADTTTSEKVVVVNGTFASRFFSKTGAVGRHVQTNRESWRVVGVAKDSKFQSLNEPSTPAVYFPVSQFFASETNFLVRANGDPAGLSRSVEEAIHGVDGALPVYGVRTLQDSIGVAYVGQRVGGSLLGFFGALALCLAAVGIYGVLAYGVSQRSREIGIRMALGANRGDVFRLILGQGFYLALAGLAIGLGLALATTRLMTTLLFGVSPTDLPTIAGVSALLLAVVTAASYFPARRATRIDPITAIRYE